MHCSVRGALHEQPNASYTSTSEAEEQSKEVQLISDATEHILKLNRKYLWQQVFPAKVNAINYSQLNIHIYTIIPWGNSFSTFNWAVGPRAVGWWGKCTLCPETSVASNSNLMKHLSSSHLTTKLTAKNPDLGSSPNPNLLTKQTDPAVQLQAAEAGFLLLHKSL